MLVDAASLYFRAFYGVPESITAPDGSPVNAVRGFADMVARLVTERRPARLVACLDLDWRPAFRVAAIPSYKAHRLDTEGEANAEQVPDALASQVPVILELLAAAGIATAGAEGYEADDVIGTLVTTERRDPVEVITGDRDLFQVVRERPTPVRVVYVARGLGKAEVLGPEEVAARCGLPVTGTGAAYADLAVLRGDPSDGLPGVPGVGEKTAAGLLTRFGSLDGVLAALDGRDPGLTPGLRRKLSGAREYLAVAPDVVRVASTAPVRLDRADTLPQAPADPDALSRLARGWGLDGPMQRLARALGG